MSATTVNSFPSLHSLNSPRGWALAIIVLVHLGFFWALSSGLTPSIINVFVSKPPQLIEQWVKPQDPPKQPIEPVDIDRVQFTAPPQPTPIIDEFDNPPITVATEPTPPNSFIDNTGDVSPPQPVVVEPRIDARRGLSEPMYPPQSTRAGEQGTVLLSVYILPDGRVGEVKLSQSSGYPRLDESALREAKRWRFVPGTSDGAPVAMWKQVPVKFRLTNQ